MGKRLILLLLFIPFLAKGQATLKFVNNEFKILQFTDLHLGSADNYLEFNNKTLSLISHIIQEEKPNLIVFTGDVVTQGKAKNVWKQLVDSVKQYNIPFAVTFGNHDTETSMSPKRVLTLLQKEPLNITYNVNKHIDGVGNFYTEVKLNDTTNWVLFFLDSHAYPKKKKDGRYDWIKPNQINWYAQQHDYINNKNGKIIPSLAFFHIPLPEYKIVKEQDSTLGNKLEDVCSPDFNSGFFSSLVQHKSTVATFTGHDHNNDFVGVLNGVCLAYGRKTGCKPAYSEPLERGARVIILHSNTSKITTYIRTQNSKIFPFTYNR